MATAYLVSGAIGFQAAGAFIILSAAWKVLYQVQQLGDLAVTGPYSRIRLPQYAGFVLIMFGFLVQWPTLLTLAMFPILFVMYWRLALIEERETEAKFGERYRLYARSTPRFIPTFSRDPGSAPHGHGSE